MIKRKKIELKSPQDYSFIELEKTLKSLNLYKEEIIYFEVIMKKVIKFFKANQEKNNFFLIFQLNDKEKNYAMVYLDDSNLPSEKNNYVLKKCRIFLENQNNICILNVNHNDKKYKFSVKKVDNKTIIEDFNKKMHGIITIKNKNFVKNVIFYHNKLNNQNFIKKIYSYLKNYDDEKK